MTNTNRTHQFLSVLAAMLLVQAARAEQQPVKQLDPVVVSASRTEQRRFDAPAAIDSVPIDGFRTASPLVNLSELTGSVPGVIARNRENFAQDLQISIRGFGTRSTFGVRGVRILIDGIPATMPDGQGQISTASLSSAQRVEFLRGPLAQLYGNAAGGVLQVFTQDPPSAPFARLSTGAGSDGQRQIGASVGGGTENLGGVLDVSRFSTDGYRDHSAAKRTHLNAKVVAKPSSSTTVTGIVNGLRQPGTQDPLGLTRADFESNPRQATRNAYIFDTRKSVEQWQAGVVLDHELSPSDSLNGRVYGGTRKINQTLAFSGGDPGRSGGVVDLDRGYGGFGLNWTRKTSANGLPLVWTVGVEADRMKERRRGFVNNNGVSGATRRDEDNVASNRDVFGQLDWTLAPAWRAIAGFRSSEVRFSVDDNHINANSPDDSGSVRFRNTSPVAGLVWHAGDDVNIYTNLGRGFETPTLAESAYRRGGTGPNFALRPSTNTQAEIGMKIRRGRHNIDLALFDARSKDEIVLQSNIGGRAIYQNVDQVQRRGAEASWQANWGAVASRVAYTWLDARFRQSFSNGAAVIAAGNRLPGVPMHSLFTDIEYRPAAPMSLGVEMRAEGKSYVNDVNSDAASGYTVFNVRAGYEFKAGPAAWHLFGRIDNLFDRRHAGSVIVNEGNDRFFEPAAGRRIFVGLRSMF
ncbi:MAG: ligand-gated channel protein [Burkholderiales bacterium RIFCSPLOWO2_02_FULL_57_36]|nr:MAG: ligand-gated channel protein [Burkholderiales bacterium RIFCSPLOWO2_02_FULL_57_36]